jgi:hypothetical protein
MGISSKIFLREKIKDVYMELCAIKSEILV